MTAPLGIILYGPPASGKSTITRELAFQDSRFQLFRRIKVGPGRRNEYRMMAPEELDLLREREEIIWENRRYGAVYAIDRPELVRMAANGMIPAVHLGQTAAVDALATRSPLSWLTVSLESPRSVAVARIQARATGDTAARLTAWDQTTALVDPDLAVDTSTCSVKEAARLVQARYERTWRAVAP